MSLEPSLFRCLNASWQWAQPEFISSSSPFHVSVLLIPLFSTPSTQTSKPCKLNPLTSLKPNPWGANWQIGTE